MIYKKRNKIKIFIVAALLIGAGLFFLFSNGFKENITAGFISNNKNVEVFADPSLKEDIDKTLSSQNLVFQYTDKESSADVILSSEENKRLETVDSAEDYYIPVVSCFNRLDEVSSKDLEKIFRKEITSWKELGSENAEIKIVILDSTEIKEKLKDFFGVSTDNFEKVSNLEELISKVSQDRKYLSFLPIEDLDTRVNSLSVNSISPVKSKDSAGYPYKIKYFLQSNKKNSSVQLKIVESLREYLSDFKSETVEIVALGDIMLSRHVGTKIRESGDSALPFRKLASLTSTADITFANLESPFFNQGPPIKEGMVFKAEPGTIEGLKLAGIDLVSLANNHFGNQGRMGMNFTFDFLKQNNIFYFGAGRNGTEAHTPAVIEKNGTKFAFLSYNEISPESYKSTADTAGVAWISEKEEDLKAMEEDIKRAKEKADLVVLSFHWGDEYKVNPNKKQQTIAKRAIDAGAEIILAQHPHVVQGVGFFDGKFIAYSLGNFVFDQMWSEETREGLIAKVYFKGKKAIDIDFVSIKIENFNQPRLASEAEAQKILDRIFSASDLSQ